jgi:hypothetical protein
MAVPNIARFVIHYGDRGSQEVAYAPKELSREQLDIVNPAIQAIFAKAFKENDLFEDELSADARPVKPDRAEIHLTLGDYQHITVVNAASKDATEITRVDRGYQVGSQAYTDDGDLRHFSDVYNTVNDAALPILAQRAAASPVSHTHGTPITTTIPGVPTGAMPPGSPYVIHINCCGGGGGGFAADPAMAFQLERINATLTRLEDRVDQLTRQVQDYVRRPPVERDDEEPPRLGRGLQRAQEENDGLRHQLRRMGDDFDHQIRQLRQQSALEIDQIRRAALQEREEAQRKYRALHEKATRLLQQKDLDLQTLQQRNLLLERAILEARAQLDRLNAQLAQLPAQIGAVDYDDGTLEAATYEAQQLIDDE